MVNSTRPNFSDGLHVYLSPVTKHKKPRCRVVVDDFDQEEKIMHLLVVQGKGTRKPHKVAHKDGCTSDRDPGNDPDKYMYVCCCEDYHIAN